MLKDFKPYIFLNILFTLIMGVTLHTYYEKSCPVIPINSDTDSSINYWLTVILIPLDSRPPCTQFVEQLAHIAGIKLLQPEPELLDDYKNLANKQALRIWLSQESKKADAAIISTDMLIHGGLLASRHSTGTTEDYKDVLELLTTIHKENIHLKMYVFNIIPRLLIADNSGNATHQKNMLTYSVVKEQVYTFENTEDMKKMNKLEKEIPNNIVTHYIDMYEQNNILNSKLMNMVEQGILAGLVIGQDDGQPFGIANMNKQQLQYQLAQNSSLADKVFITRGTDEVALTLLGHIAMQYSNYKPRVFVEYSNTDVPRMTMPFMPHTVATNVQEKLRIAGTIEVNNADEADVILYVHVGNKNNKDTFTSSAQHLKKLIDQEYKVALVDLTENFQISETLLPTLLRQNVPIAKLIAYAGWNTTSNSIGTAVTQSCIFVKQLTKQTNMPETMTIYKDNLEFLIARFLDDLYYQKEINPYMNKQLQRLHIDPYNLGSYYYQTNFLIQKRMISKAKYLLREGLYNCPITIKNIQGRHKIIITDLDVQTYLPWKRTFEIWIKPTLSLSIIK
jgi:hypothetical protein